MEYSPIIYFVDPNVAKTRLDWMRIMILKISYLYLSARYYGDEVNLPIQFWKVRFVWLLRTLWSWTLATLILSWTNVLHVNPHSAVFRQTTHGIRQIIVNGKGQNDTWKRTCKASVFFDKRAMEMVLRWMELDIDAWNSTMVNGNGHTQIKYWISLIFIVRFYSCKDVPLYNIIGHQIVE